MTRIVTRPPRRPKLEAGVRRQRGLSLVELMVSITVGLLIVGAVLYVYLGSRGAYRTNKSTSRTQEAGRFGLDAIARDVREAGFIGCGSRQSPATLRAVNVIQTALGNATVGNISFTSASQALAGFKASSYLPGATNPWAPPAGQPAWYAGDVLVLNVATASPVMLVADSNLAKPAIFLANNCAGIRTDDFILASNCTTAAILRVSNAPANSCPANGVQAGGVEVDYAPTDAAGNTINVAGNTPAFNYSTLPSAQPFDEVTYYVGQITVGTYQRQALFRYSARNSVAEEIIDHVQNMSVYYGVPPANGGAVQYLDAAQVQAANAWGSVTSVRIQLLTEGDEAGAVDTEPRLNFGAPGALPFVPNDPAHHYWQVYTATAALRDRLP
jgi:type IV pilus assembly protein PilW